MQKLRKKRSVVKDTIRLVYAEDLLKQILSKGESGKIRVTSDNIELFSKIKQFLNEESKENRYHTEQD